MKNETAVRCTNQGFFEQGRTHIVIDSDQTLIDIQHTLLPGTEKVDLVVLRDCEVVVTNHFDTVGALGSDNLYHIGFNTRLKGYDPLDLLNATFITVAFIRHNGTTSFHPREIFGFRVIAGRIHPSLDLDGHVSQLEQLSRERYGGVAVLKKAFGYLPKDTTLELVPGKSIHDLCRTSEKKCT